MDKKILVLAVLFVALGFGVYNKFNQDKKDVKDSSVNTFISNNVLTDTKEIEVVSKDNKTVLAVNDKNWVVKNRFNWDSDFSKIKGLIDDIKSIKTVHSFKPEEDSLKKLELESPVKKDAENTGVLISLKNEKGEKIFSLLKGKNRSKGGQYIIKNNENTILLSENSIYVQTNPSDWLKSELINIKKDKVKDISVYDSKDKKLYQLKMNKELLKPELSYPAKNKKEIDKEKSESVFSSLSNLEFNDIEKEKNKDEKNDFRLDFDCEDEIKISVFVHPSSDDKNLISFKIKNTQDKKDITIAENIENFIFSVSKWEFEKFVTDKNELFKKDKK